MSLDIAVDDRPAATVVAIGGELDLNTAPELLQALTRLVDDGRRHLIVDLSRLTFCDSSGLSVLVRVRNRLDGRAGDVRLASPRPIVSRVLDVSGLAEVFGTYPSVREAYAAALGGAPSVVEPAMDDR
jgi:anti-sigma B factor antagonist